MIRKNRKVITLCLFFIGYVALSIFICSHPKLDIEPITGDPDNNVRKNISFLADQMFVYIVPVFFVMIGYIIHILNKISIKSN